MNERARVLHYGIRHGLTHSTVVCCDFNVYAEAHGITSRSGRRDLAGIKKVSGALVKMRGGQHYFSREAVDIGELLSGKGRFISLPDFLEAIDVAPDVPVGKCLSIYLERGDMLPGMTFFDVEEKVERIEPSGTFGELSSMVATVCKINPLLLLEDDEYKIEKLFKIGASADAVYRHYARSTKPNFWYNGHWKGKKNAWPTIVDILRTWDQSATHVLRPCDSWPGFEEIYKTIGIAMNRRGRRYSKEALAELSEFGYDEIVRNIEGGYVHAAGMTERELRIKIAQQIRLIKDADPQEE
ncbi:hypothetical protein DRQ25_08105 [Candidatus Fermentibacteria bacterium]|nr:MAG: hypothetical protein DRQ25_08105 [Candidatus Fermentibacteria bacterium]